MATKYTYKQKFNKKYGFKLNEPHNKKEISSITGIPMRYLDMSFDRGVGAYKTNPQSVRKNVKSPEQWAYARIYSMVMGGKADPDLQEKFKKLKRYKEKST